MQESDCSPVGVGKIHPQSQWSYTRNGVVLNLPRPQLLDYPNSKEIRFKQNKYMQLFLFDSASLFLRSHLAKPALVGMIKLVVKNPIRSYKTCNQFLVTICYFPPDDLSPRPGALHGLTETRRNLLD